MHEVDSYSAQIAERFEPNTVFGHSTQYNHLVTFCVNRIDDAKCVLVTRACVSVCPSPHSHTAARTRM